MKGKKEKKQVTERERKTVLTFFILLFPSMIIIGLLTMSESLFKDVSLAIALFFYQAILLKNFIDDHYRLTSE